MNDLIVVRSGIEALVGGVRDYFEAIGCTAKVDFGYRARQAQLNQGPGGANRVVFLPGDPNGSGGRLAQPRDVGRRQVLDGTTVVGHIRPLASWERQFSVSIWARESTRPMDELLQAVECEDLLEKTVQAIEQFVGAGGMNVAMGAITWTVPQTGASHGTELLLGLALAHPLFDAAEEMGFPGFTLERDDDGLDGNDADANG